MLNKTIEIQVLRYRPEQDDKPLWQSYRVPFTDDMSVLQGLQHIKDEIDGTLSFRWSCRMAICGSCGMMVNGKPKLSCQTFLRDLLPGPVRIEALAHFPIERDLIVSVGEFVKKLEGIQPWIIPKAPRTLREGDHPFAGALETTNGILRINFVVPDTINPGAPTLVITAGGVDSQAGITVNVR